MTLGTLRVKSKKNKKGNVKKTYEFFYTNSNNQYRSLSFKDIPEDQIAPELLEKIEDATTLSIAVEFEEEGDRIIKLREQGEPWHEDVAPPPERSRPVDNPRTVNPQSFHNPYNFVPALPRDKAKGELGDRKPSGHGRYLSDHWSGRISVKLTTVTPLLIPDAAEMTDDNGHKTYPVRLGNDGKPYLPPTSIKGMLRSAYEAVTNSRLSVLDSHDARLAYRMPAKIGLQMVPARVESETIHLYPGTSRIGNDGRPTDEMYAAWLPRYDRGSTRLRFEVRYPDRTLPQHGDHVKFWAEKYGKSRNGNLIFTYWKVRRIARYEEDTPSRPDPSNGHGNHCPIGNEIKEFEGYVYVTNKNIDSKHDERVFIVNDFSVAISLTSDLRKKWKELIANYQEEHKEEIRKGLESPPALNRSSWSRQIIVGKVEQTLKDGSLCYAHVKQENGNYQVLDLYPVMITRGLFEMSPIQLLDSSLRPTTQNDKLSPADRVFGWVNQKGKGAYKGHLRVHSVRCVSDDPINDFGSEVATLPLSILGQPKPQQARFYCADQQDGRPLPDGDSKEEGYKYDDQALRGRKVYPHHQGLPEDYWYEPTQDRRDSINGHYQEYRQPMGENERTDQNRSVKNWVKPETEFTFDIDVTNLSQVELGALLWLLASPDVYYHRLGGAKPLGFGSVWLDIDWGKSDLRLGADWCEFYQSLTPVSVQNSEPLSTIQVYKDAISNNYGNGSDFGKVPFITAFYLSSKGFDDNAAIHYPRSTPDPKPEGEAFEWFVQNEKSGNPSGMRLSLPSLANGNPCSLPIWPCQ